MKEVILTEEELLQLCSYWQKTLGLSEWNIKLRVCGKDELCLEPYEEDIFQVAQNTFSKTTLHSRITIIKHDDWNSDFAHDMEQSLVHELLHLHYWAFEPEYATTEFMLWERSINQIATGLVRVRREGEQEVNELYQKKVSKTRS